MKESLRELKELDLTSLNDNLTDDVFSTHTACIAWITIIAIVFLHIYAYTH